MRIFRFYRPTNCVRKFIVIPSTGWNILFYNFNSLICNSFYIIFYSFTWNTWRNFNHVSPFNYTNKTELTCCREGFIWCALNLIWFGGAFAFSTIPFLIKDVENELRYGFPASRIRRWFQFKRTVCRIVYDLDTRRKPVEKYSNDSRIG